MSAEPPVQTSDGPSKPADLKSHYAFRPHPLLPLPTEAEMAEDLKTPEGAEQLQRFLNARAERLRLAEVDPVHYRLRLPQSRDVDELLREYQIVYESGGKRAGKTEDGVPRFLECCLEYPNSKRWAMQDNEKTSIATLQQLFWKYLPQSIKRLNGKRNAQYKINYTQATGFAERILVLPNGTEVHFLTYNQNVSDFLGWELGKPVDIPLNPQVADIGALLDENLTKAWLDNVLLRCSTRGAKVHWMYSPQEGITLAIKDLVTGVRTIATKTAELLPGRVNVPGIPAGEMPYIQVDKARRIAVFYRFTQWNPFSGYDRPGGVKELCEGKPLDYIKRHAYGYCEALKGRVFPKFGEWNLVTDADLPAEATNYMVTDPGGARNWFTLWARVTPGDERTREIFIYREWPDYDTYGEWAKVSENARKLNGERGPAQPTLGYGPAEYKKLFLQLERIPVPAQLLPAAKRGEFSAEEWDAVLKPITDPQARRLLKRAWTAEEIDESHLQEEIFQRLIDPRAARNQSAADRKGVCVLTKLEEVNRDPRSGELIAGPMYFQPAPGLDIADGISQINEYLFFDDTQDRVRLLNAPRLFVHERCRNLIWAMKNYSLPDDIDRQSDDACEDPIDCLRYLVTAGVRFILPGGKIKTTGGGAY